MRTLRRPPPAPISKSTSRSSTRNAARQIPGFRQRVPFPPECNLAEQIDAKTGQRMPAQLYEQWCERAEKTHQQQRRLARLLGKGKHGRPDRTDDGLTLVGLMTGHAERAIKTPRWKCLPWNAAVSRDELMLNLTFYLAHRPDARHIRVTQGERVPLNDIRVTAMGLSKSISRLNTRSWFREQVEIVFRCVEVTWNGSSAHVHAHLVLLPVNPLSDEQWIELNGHIQQCLGGHADEPSTLGEIEKAVPYLAKPVDFDELRGDEIVTFAEQMRGLRTHEPAGDFRKFCRRLKRAGMKLIRRGGEIVMVSRSDGLRRTSQRGGPSCRRKRPTLLTDQILRIGPPRPHGSNLLQPVIYVNNYSDDFERFLANNPDIQEMRDRLMEQWPRRPRTSKRSYSSL